MAVGERFGGLSEVDGVAEVRAVAANGFGEAKVVEASTHCHSDGDGIGCES